MSYIKHIILTQFRNYSYHSFIFNAPIVAITGKNGTGKTNLLDAIYYLCFTKSYFQSKEINNIQHNTNGFRIEGKIDNDMITCVWKKGTKKIFRNDIVYEKIADHIGQFSAVMIAPDDIKIINDSADNRRKFIDGIICQTNKQYLESLLQYQRILLRKNAYLKQMQGLQADTELISIYNKELLVSGNYLIKQREKTTLELAPLIKKYYKTISAANEEIDIKYNPHIRKAEYGETLLQFYKKESEAGRSLIGPHLDDWELSINNLPFKTQSSQGQKKSLLIALKLAQIHFMRNAGKNPILLLDDIFEKLDKSRIDLFFNLLNDINLPQILLTHTDEDEAETFIKRHFINFQAVHLA